MAEHLIFTLTAAIGSAGELAGHERRPSLGWPGRSAILGLVGAAMGIRRDDAEGLARLDRLRVAVAIFDTGTPLRDYHTVQTVPTAKAKRPNSRPDAMRAAGRQGLNTTLTQRDYRQGALYGVALTGPGLASVEAALMRPVFTLSFGRKACPLAAPLCPHIVEASGPAEALASLRLPPWRAGAVAEEMVVDPEAGPENGPADGLGGRREWRHDVATDRRAWHFAARQIVVTPCRIAPGEVAA